jgi:hypothetical protein
VLSSGQLFDEKAGEREAAEESRAHGNLVSIAVSFPVTHHLMPGEPSRASEQRRDVDHPAARTSAANPTQSPDRSSTVCQRLLSTDWPSRRAEVAAQRAEPVLLPGTRRKDSLTCAGPDRQLPELTQGPRRVCGLLIQKESTRLPLAAEEGLSGAAGGACVQLMWLLLAGFNDWGFAHAVGGRVKVKLARISSTVFSMASAGALLYSMKQLEEARRIMHVCL